MPKLMTEDGEELAMHAILHDLANVAMKVEGSAVCNGQKSMLR